MKRRGAQREGWMGGALLAAAASACALPSQAQTAGFAGDAKNPYQIQNVIVTARKRPELVEQVPIAITAIAGADQALFQQRDITDLNPYAPSTNFAVQGPHQSSFAIRGIGSNPDNDGLAQSAGLFLDGVYLGRAGMASTDLTDIAQIDVLRGPQGTLYGKNTTAGAVNISTNPPTFTPHASVSASYGSYDTRLFQAMVNGPLTNTLAVRLTAYDDRRDGDVTDVTNGSHLAGVNRQGGRLQFLYQPNSAISVRWINQYDLESDSSGVAVLDSLGATPAVLLSRYAAAGASIAIDPQGSLTADNDPMISKTNQYATSVQIDWNTGPLTVTSLSAYRSWRYYSMADIDQSNKSILNAGYNLLDSQFSQELRVATPKDARFESVAGLYYFQQSLSVDQITRYGSEAAAFISGVPDALLPLYAAVSPMLQGVLAYNNSQWDIFANPQIHSYAAFGQSTWHATSRLDVTAGLRVTEESTSETVSRPNPTDTVTGLPSPALAYAVYPSTKVSINNTAPSFLLTGSYALSADVLAYATVSRGEKAGGVNASVPGALGPDSLKVRPEIAVDYEAGLKGRYLDRKLQLNVGLFDTEISDYQATYVQTPAGGGLPVSVLANVGQVRSRGLEAEATALPTPSLPIAVAASYNDAIYLSYVDGPCPAEIPNATVCNLSGKPVSGAPRWIVNVSSRYEQAVGPLVAYAAGQYSWRSAYYGYLDDSAYTLTGNVAVVNLAVGAKAGALDVSIWAKNLGDERKATGYLSVGSLLPGAYVPFYGDPRVIGVTIKAAL